MEQEHFEYEDGFTRFIRNCKRIKRAVSRPLGKVKRWAVKRFKALKKRLQKDYKAWKRQEEARRKAELLAKKRMNNPNCLSTAEVVKAHKRRLKSGRATSVKTHQRTSKRRKSA